MRIELTRESFLKSASLATQVISLRPNLPILGNFLVAADTGALEITATNLETTLAIKTPAKVIKGGRATVPARVLVDFCQAASSEQISLAFERDSLVVVSGRAKAVLPTVNPSEFPSLGNFDSTNAISLEKKKFLDAVSQVSFCAAPEEGRPILTGVLLEGSGKKINLVATDGYRLAKKELAAEGLFEFVVPARALRESTKATSEQEDERLELAVNKEKNQARIKTKNLTITSRLLEGAYPNYDQIIPGTFISEAVVDTKELIAAIKLAALFARDVGNVVRFDLNGKQLKVEASTAQVGQAETTLTVKSSGEQLKTAFNSRFVLDCLGTIKNNETEVSFSGPTSATLFRGKGDRSLTHVVMPVRIQS